MRVYEYSRQYGIPNKEIIKILKDGGFDIQNHMSVLNQESINYLQNYPNTQNKKNIEQKLQSTKIDELKVEDKKNSFKESFEKDEKSKQTTHSITEKQHLKSETNDHKLKDVTIIIKPMMLGELASLLNIPATEIILSLLKKGLAYNKNQVLPENIVEQIANQYEVKVEKEEKKITAPKVVKVGEKLTTRPPVVVVIGHVDHGKTTLLDYIRKSRVAAKEKGGITQHLGAYQVLTPQGKIVFLDTPGHEAFSMMRGRGIKLADIAILIVAADDGVMPQTIEAIKLAQSKNIPIIVAVNKIDKVDEGRLDQIKTQLSKYNVISEDWGGQSIFVPISAKYGQGIDQLLEMIILQSEVMELKADESIEACGYVLEAKIEKGLGPVATFIAQHGKIKIGDFFICGNTYGKVTVLMNSNKERVQEVGPSIPVQISGFEELPKVGDYLQVVSENKFRNIKSDRNEKKSSVPLKSISKESINIILKTDNDSSKEALIGSINKLSKKEEIYIVYSGVGNINEHDVILAANSNAKIYGFGVKTDFNLSPIVQKFNVSIKNFDIIYKLLDDIKELIESKKEVQYKKVKTGGALIRKVFNIKGLGVIAGFYVKDGKIVKEGQITIYRGSKKIGEGPIKTLQREKKSVKEVNNGFEGALLIEGYQDWIVDDRIECFINVPI